MAQGVVADLDHNLAVVAGAGSGKTSALVDRLIAHVLVGTPLDQIAAITFTRKAAAEMRARFASELQNLRDELSDELSNEHAAHILNRLNDERQRVDEALRHIDRCFISTIHSFCQELLRSAPAEASAVGIPPAFSLVDDWQEEQLRKTFWRRHVAMQLRADERELVELERLGIEPTDLYDFFGELSDFENLVVYAPDTSRPDLREAVESVTAFVETWQAERPNPPLGTRDKLQETLDRAKAHLRVADPAHPAALIRLVEMFASASGTAVTLNRWSGNHAEMTSDDAKALRDEVVPALRNDFVLPLLEKWQAFVYGRLVTFCGPAVAEYAEYRKRQGKLTQSDSLLRAAELFRNPDYGKSARRRLRDRYRFLLVDEFQDTDPVQAEVLFLLTAENDDLENERSVIDWRRARPRPGSLFVVGDDKQSIYRFRRADIQVFSEVSERLHPADEPLRLTTNFRSESTLCNWINGALAPVFADDRELEGGKRRQPPYEPLRAFSEDEAPEKPRIRKLSIEKTTGDFADPIASAESERIADCIQYACANGSKPSDFLVLARVSKRLGIFTSALEARGIPYSVTGSKGFGDMPEVKAVIRMLETIVDPSDGPSRLAFLTGPFCGISHTQLFRYTRTGASLTGSPPVKLPGDVTEADGEAFSLAWNLLRQARDWLVSLPPSAALGRVLETSGLLAAAAQAPGGTTRAGSLLKLVALVRDLEADGLHWMDVLDELLRYENRTQVMDEGSLEIGPSSAVRLMTVHQSKGLQAPCVFLADPYDRFPNTTVSSHVFRTEDGEPTAVIPYLKGFGNGRKAIASPLNWSSHLEDAATFENEERSFAAAEAHRLLYVACTRAEQLLVVSRYAAASREEFANWGALEPALVDVLELDQPPEFVGTLQQKADPTLFTPRPDAFDTRSKYAVRNPSHTHANIGPSNEGDGHGTGFGNAVHGLFEWMIASRDRDYDDGRARHLAGRLLTENNVSESLLSAALEAARRLRESTLWASLAVARDVRVEAQFTAPDLSQIGDVITGRIDLAYLDDDGWHLVDFKTDRIKDEAHRSSLKEHYAAQLIMYQDCWEAASGSRPTASLWFSEEQIT